MTDRAAILAELLQDPMRARLVPRAEAEDLLVELARVQRALELLSGSAAPPAQTAEASELLTPEQVAAMLSKPRTAVYGLARRADWRPFVVRVNKRTLRFN